MKAAALALACILILMIFNVRSPVAPGPAPRPIAPQQLVIPSGGVFTHVVRQGDTMHRLAKYAICRFRAMVPSRKEIDDYINEVITIHNLTRRDGEPRIFQYTLPVGTSVSFYPPMNISNDQERRLVPVYSYFVKLVDDPFAYVTGDWCERGTGGGQPHYGIDVAANRGTRVIAPLSGKVHHLTNDLAGRTVGIVNGHTVIFFCHLDKRFFSDGTVIKEGQVLGTVGMTGRTSGPHVHVGYGVRSQSRGDVKFGKTNYRVTDPKLFFYREMFFEQIAQQ